ncbi:relaxase/mobilization nuclease domain-containing protein [Sphingopyxis sp.]|uniref:relaxase/mobilization nuclease domain-containing protein n=1 Tax=Sphingopyxis sp. TaxID=1908224 RepID=UPI002D77EB87|nr:relaxase/mobilization nuclease domain-containing protein [Sphingopyxis sp.]HET6526057.1 relaxase/mobilization nuclease domain-containing protein [Sphingopyxis sp.]
MIGKLIGMNRRGSNAPTGRMDRLRKSVFALTRYIVDADPHALIESSGHDILSLTDYALAIEMLGAQPGEKVAAFGARNLIGNDLADWQVQMLAVAARAPTVQSPLLHIILSLREGEVWAADQRDEAIDIALTTLKLERCPVVWAEHSNTQNPHLHLSVVRVDPATGKAAGTDWLIDDLHQALALIEERQGRTREPDALYIARGGAVFDADSGAMVRDRDGTFISGWYKGRGTKHKRLPEALNRRRADLIHAAAGAHSWADVHEAFAAMNCAYDRAGSGARIAYAGQSVKASVLHSSLARTSLEKRLGPFEPDIGRLDSGFEAYRHALDSQLAELRAQRDQECARIDAWAQSIIDTLPSGADSNIRAAILAEARAARDSLQSAFAHAIDQCTQQRLGQEAWIASGRPAFHRAQTPALLLPGQIDGVEKKAAYPPEFVKRDVNWSTQYRDASGDLMFTDHRIFILVHQSGDVRAVDGALRLAAARWRTVRVHGPEAFLSLVAVRAAELQIPVIDSDGCPLVVKAKLPETDIIVSVESQPVSSSWKVPSPEDDIQRRDRIASAIRFLKSHPGLPLRRIRESDNDDANGRRGHLEIVVDDDELDPMSQQLRRQAVFDRDIRIQAFLEDHRSKMLQEVYSQLSTAAVNRLPETRSEILALLPKKAHIRRAAALAMADHDFILMLQRVRERLLEQQRVRILRRQKLNLEARKIERAQSNNLATEREEEMGVELQASHLRKLGLDNGL